MKKREPQNESPSLSETIYSSEIMKKREMKPEKLGVDEFIYDESMVEDFADPAAGKLLSEIEAFEKEKKLNSKKYQGGSQSVRTIKIDIERMISMGMVTPKTAKSRISEEYRLIKLPLLKNAFGEGAAYVEQGNLIMVTSSQPGEGKTFTSINLAMSLAMELDKTVLLVDADVARPSVMKTLDIDADQGLVDYLLNPGMDLSEVLLRTNIPNLTLLPAGKIYSRSTELVASDAMRTLCTELSRRYHDRIVIFDSPPLLASSEAAVLSNLVGQIIMVVEAERTLQYILSEALGLLNQDKVIGLVLNKSSSPRGTDYYGSYAYGSQSK